MRKIVLLSLTVFFAFTALAQDFSNKGKDFWVGYGYHQVMTGGNTQDMVLYFATDQVTNITISIPALGYTQNLTSPAGNNVLTSAIIPKTVPDARLTTEGTSNAGIHITSDKAMVAYAHIYNQSVSGATILYPTNTLGKEYYSVNYKNWSNSNNANCWFYVVATDTGTTTVEITPQAGVIGVVTTGGWVAGTTYTVNLTQGQIYNVMGILDAGSGPLPGQPNRPYTAVDLTGSAIKSVSTGNGCKRIAVFSGSGRISITCNNNSSSSDNYMVQSVPKSAWGKKYLTAPAGGNQANNIYRICVPDPTTVVAINGVITPIPNFYFEIAATNQPQMIEADKPIMVAQYFTSQNACTNGNPGDPEVIYLSAVEQNINTVLWNATPNFGITTHWVNVVIPNGGTGVSSFTFDGIPWGGFVPHPWDPNYSYLRLNVVPGPHIIRSDSGFNAIAYGFGNAESYGYNAGTNIKDLYQQILVQTQYGIEQTPSVCTGSPFRFKVSLPYCADSIQWNLSQLPGPPAAPPTQIYSTCVPGAGGPDSTTVVGGKTIYWYSLPTLYNFTVIGTYPVTITAYNSANPDGCGNAQEIDFDLQVSAPPVPNFTWTAGKCVAEPYQFTETTPQIPKATYAFWWDFGDPASGAANNSIVRNPLHTFTAPGTYTVRYTAITTPGCLTDTVSLQVVVQPLPSGIIDGSITVCQSSTPDPVIVFTGSGSTAPYTFYYNINGGPALSVSSNPPNGTGATITAPTAAAGSFVYTLDSVRTIGSALCVKPITGQLVTIAINPLPTASMTGTTAVCQNAASPNITFTGATGTAPYTFSYTINGGPVQTVTTVAGNSVNVAVPTNTVGVFTYTLVSVQDGSSTACSQLQTGSAVVTVNPLPTAAISGTTSVCQNAASPDITFTGAVGPAPYTFSYTINGGPVQTVTTVAGNSVTVAVPTGTVGTFTYALVSVQDGSSTTCSQAQTGTAVVTVNPLPTATIAGTTTVCLNSPSPNITFTGANATAPYTFSYTINGGPVQTVTTVAGNSVTVAAPTTAVGTFTYALVSVQDGSSTTCSQAQTGSAVVTVDPLPTAAIAGTTTVCLNAASPNITFTGAIGTAPYTFTYTINGGPNQIVTTVAGNSVTVPVPTNVAGTFTYSLVSVQEGSANLCSQAQTGSAVVTVSQLPTATISGTTAVCLNAPSPDITFTGANTSAPYTFSYTINGGPVQTVTTVAGNSVTVAVPTNVAGTFTYNLVGVQDGTPEACSQAQTGSVVVIVHPLPTPNFTFSTPSCETRTVTFTDGSVANAGAINAWAWNFGDPGSGPLNTSTLQNPVHVFAAAGVYNVTLTVTTNNGCVSNPVATIPVTINDRPEAGFILPEVCLSDTYAQFVDTSKIAIGTITAWNWNFGDPASGPLNTSTLQNPQHSYTAVGTYNVELIVTSALGCRDTIMQVLTVNGSFPVANFTVNNPTTLCANDSVAIVEASTVFPGVITKIEIYWDNVNFPGVFDVDNNPFTGKIYKHLYPNFQAPLTRVFTIRYRAYSGGVCVNDRLANITVNAAPLVQFNAMPDACYFVPPFQITQASETGGVPGTGVYTGPGVSVTGIFNPAAAGIGLHTILYTYTSATGGCVDTMSSTIRVLDTAVANFTYVSPVCETTPASFTDVSTAPSTVVLANTIWDFGDGSPIENHAPGSTFTHLFPAPGNYTVTMYNVSAYGCNSRPTSQVVTVNPDHTISLNAGSNDNQTICINTLIAPIVYTLGGGATGATVTGLPAGVTYTVTGTTLTIQGTVTTTVGSPFIYNIITTGNSCIIADTTGTISVNPDHTITLNAGSNKDQSVCVNTSIVPITYTLGGGANNINVAGLPSGVSATVVGNTVTIAGTPNSTAGGPLFNFTINTTGNTCLVASSAGTIRVNPYPVPMFAVDKPTYCIPNAVVTFNNSSSMPDGSGGMTYAWDFGEPLSPNNTSTGFSPSHWYSSEGPFNVRLTVTSSAVLTPSGTGCTHDTVIAVTNIHPQPKAAFSINKPAGICIGDDVTFTDNTDGKDGVVNQWFWDMGDGSIRNSNTVTYTYTDTITFSVKFYAVNSFGCNSDTITKLFTVYPYPHVNAGPDRFILEGGQIVLSPIVWGNDMQFLWTPNLYLQDNRIEKVRINKPLTDMTYTLMVTARGGCARSDDVFVKLLKFPKIPNTFTPNNDGINDTWRIDYLNTYPNNRVQVFTRTGQLVFESRGYNTPWDGTIKGKPLPFDTYYYIIEPGNGRDPISGYVTIIK